MNDIANIETLLAMQLSQLQTNLQSDIIMERIRQQTNAYGVEPAYSWHMNPSYDWSVMAMPKECCYSGPKKTNCCNCGAPLKWQRCEYCGTLNIL